MELEYFFEQTSFFDKIEIERVKLYTFYQMLKDKNHKFSVVDVSNFFTEIGINKPNASRLEKNIIKSRSFVKKGKKEFSLHVNEFNKLKKEFGDDTLIDKVKVVNYSSVLPNILYTGTRSYIESLSSQINASFENNIYDGCAVLMRRLLEILLIHSFEHYNIESEIQDVAGQYKMLSDIVRVAKHNRTLRLSRDTKECIEGFRELGNFSAHKIFYTARHEDIQREILKYRATIEELLYKSNIKT